MPLKNSGGPIVGLDIGSTFIKACEIDVRGGRAQLRGLAVLPTPPEAIVNNEIVDPIALGRTIRQTLAQSGIKAKKAIVSVAGQSSLVVRIIEVPKMTRAELQETMRWEMERHVPFAAEQVVMDFQPLVAPEEVPEGQNMEVLLAVAQEALVTRHVETLKHAGLTPLAIDIEPLATSRALLDLSNGSGPMGTVAIVDIGATSTDIGIYRDGRIAFTRSIQLAGNTLTKAISDVLGRPLAEAEQLKKDRAGVPEQPGGGAGAPLFGGMDTIDFGIDGDSAFNAAPGAATATDTQAEEDINVAGAGLTPDLFTGDAPATPPAAGAFDTPGAVAAGPVPAGNPFDPDAGADPAAGAPPAFDPSVFGEAPAGDPFGAPGDPFGAPGADPMVGFGAPAGMSDDEYIKTQISDAIMPVLHELVTELRRSLDFYRNRASGLGAQQVVICGGSAKLAGLADFLSANLEVPVVLGNPLQYVAAGPKSSPEYLQDVGPFFPVSVGLAVRELLVDNTPRTRSKK